MLEYKLWFYSVSHSVLLIRAPGSGVNNDHWFYGVHSMDFSGGTIWQDLEVEDTTDDMNEILLIVGDKKHPYKRYDLVGKNYDGEVVYGTILAAGHNHTQNDMGMFELWVKEGVKPVYANQDPMGEIELHV
jgi:hypothetical protein